VIPGRVQRPINEIMQKVCSPYFYLPKLTPLRAYVSQGATPVLPPEAQSLRLGKPNPLKRVGNSMNW
jgi:hypothetical protein